MKNLFAIIVLVAFAATSMFAQQNKKTPKMDFEQTTVDYGTIQQNSDPLRTFSFKNTGNTPLIITGARGSCGCTVPSYPKKPIAPGETAVIEVRYDTKRVGPFRKSVRITTNEKVAKKTKDDQGVIVEKEEAKTHILYIKGDVTQKKAPPAGTPTKTKSIIEE
ncbi:MAG: hypothetical protein ACJAUH_000242 [Saprospiraceae bacterium]|jgi:hypothetical protein